MNWIRVTKAIPCPVCGKDSWCCIGRRWVNCMRVVSEKPCANGGYLHPLNGVKIERPERPEPVAPTIDAAGMMKRWFCETSRDQYDSLGDSLGVAANALIALKCGWAAEHHAWAFPMRNGSGLCCGIRLRANSGRKWSVTGGKEGIFLPAVAVERTAWVCEGPTDCAALLTLGKFAIGRPSCSGGIAHLAATAARLGIQQAVIVADNDEDKLRPNGQHWNPGIDGAQRLADEIGIPCCVTVLPCKDSRELLQLGGTAELLDTLVHSCVWHQPNKRREERLAQDSPMILASDQNPSRTFHPQAA